MMFSGQKVRVKEQYQRPQDVGKVYIVVKVNPVNIRVEPEGGGRGMHGKPILFEVVGEETGSELFNRIVGGVKEVAYVPPPDFTVGEVVVAKGAVMGAKWRKSYEEGQKFVVIKVSDTKVNVVKLGGEGGRYWRMVPSSLIKSEAF